MGNRNNAALGHIEDHMATIASAERAMGRLDTLLLGLCYAPAVTLEQYDIISEEFQRILPAIALARMLAQRAREGV